MIQTMQTLTFFGIICLIFMTGIASDKNRCQTSQCIKPKTYNMSLKVLNKYSLIVVSTVQIDLCTRQYDITLYLNKYCRWFGFGVDIHTNIPYKMREDGLYWQTWSFPYSNYERLDFSLIKNNARFLKQEKMLLTQGLYTINITRNCSLEKIATSTSYFNQSDSYDTFYEFFKTLMIKKYKNKGEADDIHDPFFNSFRIFFSLSGLECTLNKCTRNHNFRDNQWKEKDKARARYTYITLRPTVKKLFKLLSLLCLLWSNIFGV